MKKFFFSLFLTTCLALTAFGQNTLIVSGTVTNMSSQPLVGYNVHIQLDSTAFFTYSNIVTTDANGAYADTITLPPAQTQGALHVYVYDCNQNQVIQNFGYNPGNLTFNNVNFQICPNTSGFCQAQFSSSPNPGSTAISFTDQSSGSSSITSWFWDFGDGNTSTQQSPTHAYNALGNYTVCLTITTSTSCTSTTCSVVTVGGSSSNCSASFTASVQALATTFTASASGTGTPVSYSWDFDDGSTGSGSTVAHTYGSPGVYIPCLTVVFSDSCVATYCDSLIVSGTSGFCTAGFFYTAQGTTVGFTDNSYSTSNITTWAWDFGDGNSATTSSGNVTHTYASTGVYTVCLTITTTNNCTDTYCATVSMNSGGSTCQAGFLHYPDTTGQYTIIGVNTSQGSNLNYFWDFGDGNTSTQAYPIHQYAGPGTYVICLTVTNGSPSCQSTYCDSVTVTQKMASAFTFAVLNGTSSVEPAANWTNLELWPNPATDRVHIRLDIQAASALSLQVMDVQGRTVIGWNGRVATGEHTQELDIRALPAGLYLARVQVGDQVVTKKLIID